MNLTPKEHKLTEEELLKIRYTNLKAKTSYSLGTGVGLVKDHLKYSIKKGHEGTTIVDNGVMMASLDLYNQAQDGKLLEKSGYKGKKFPSVMGATLYITEDTNVKTKLNKSSNITIYVKNEQGYKNACYLTSIGSIKEKFYSVPRIDFEDLFANKEGLIVTNGGFNGVITNPLMENAGELKEIVLKIVNHFSLAEIQKFNSVDLDVLRKMTGELNFTDKEATKLFTFIQDNANKEALEILKSNDKFFKIIKDSTNVFPISKQTVAEITSDESITEDQQIALFLILIDTPAELMIKKFKEEFGDDFYLETNFHSQKFQWDRELKQHTELDHDDQEDYILKIIDVSTRHNIKVLAVQDSYMQKPEQHIIQSIMLWNRPGSKDGFFFYNAQFLMTVPEFYEQMCNNFGWVSDEQFVEWTSNSAEVLDKCKNLKLSFRPSLPKLAYDEHYVNKIPVVIKRKLMTTLQDAGVWNETIKGRIRANQSIQEEDTISDRIKAEFNSPELVIDFDDMEKRTAENVKLEEILTNMEEFYKESDPAFTKLLRRSRNDLQTRTSLKVMIRNKKLVPKLIDEVKMKEFIDTKSPGKKLSDFSQDILFRVAEKNGFFLKTDDDMYALGDAPRRARLVEEVNTIQYNGILRLTTYFMLLEDVSNFVKENGYLRGFGRGSGAGSIVAYALDITDCDPLQYDLLFERFLTKERIGELFWDQEGFDLKAFLKGNDQTFDDEKLMPLIAKEIIKDRMSDKLNEWQESELFFLECNPEIAAYLLHIKKELKGQKIPNKNNSTLVYLMGISDEIPTKEVNATPTTLPDIDYDTNARDQVKEYLVFKFGREKVTLMGTFGTLKTKGAVKDLFRQLRSEVSFDVVNEMTKLFDNLKRTDYGEELEFFTAGIKYIKDLGDTVGDSIANEDLKQKVKMAVSDLLSDDITSQLEELLGNVKSTGIHAGGIIVAGDDVTRIVPCSFERDENMWVTQPDMKYVEWAGLIKYDFLGLNTLNDINHAFRHIEKRHGIIYDFSKIPINDPTVMKKFQRGDTMSIFQFGTFLAHSILTKLKEVRNIGDLAIITSIARPGPLEMGMEKTFIARVNKDEPIAYMHPSLEGILKETYGITCIAEGGKVLTRRGLTPIQEILIGDLVKTEDGSWQKVLNVLDQGFKQTLRIRPSNGEELVCTKDHKVLTQDGWKEAQDLTTKDIIKSFWMSPLKTKIGDLKDWLIGLALADGDLCNSTTSISCSSEEFANKVARIAEQAFGLKNCKVYFKTRCWYVSLGHFDKDDHGQMRNHPFKDELKRRGINKLDCYTKRLPEDYTLMMLVGFIEGDGCLRTSKIRLKNDQLAYDLFLAFQSYRIPSSFYIDIDGASTVTFHDYKNILDFQVKEKLFVESNAVYYPRKYLPKYGRKDGVALSQMTSPSAIKNKPFIKYNSFKKTNIIPEHELWAKVLSVKENTVQHVYDLSIENVHSFTVGGLVVHNCYQEQVMKTVRELADFTGNESVVILKAMGKKQVDKLIKFKAQFIKNSIAKYPETADLINFEDPETKQMKKYILAEAIYEFLLAFAKYGFNKSHAVAYANVSYVCMWLKHYYPIEWITGVLSGSDKEDFKEFYTQWHKSISKPDINKSKKSYVIEKVDGEDKCIMPFSFINGVGDKAVDSIIDKQPYTSFEDFFGRVDHRKINKTTMVNLIFAGTFDSLKEKPEQPIADYRKFIINEFFRLKTAKKKPSKKELVEFQEIMDEARDMTRGKFLMKEVTLLNLTAFNYYEFYKDSMTRGSIKNFGSEAITPKEALNKRDKDTVVVGGAVESITFFPVKNGKDRGKDMAKIVLINEESKIKVTVFASQVDEIIKGLQEFTPMIIKGKIQVDQKWGTAIIYEKCWILS